MNLLKNIICCAAITLILLGVSCTKDLAGAGSETTNSITGTIANASGIPAANTVVYLFPEDYNPSGKNPLSTIISDTTGANGTFIFDNVDTGVYNLLARNALSAENLMVQSIAVDSTDTIIELPQAHLSKPCTVTADFSLSTFPDSGILYIPGTDIYTEVHGESAVTITDIPAGLLQALIYTNSSGTVVNTLRSTVTLIPGESISVVNPLWKNARTITFNTSLSGAAITTDQYNFPVLIRLDNTNFSFSSDKILQKSLLFTKSDNTPLPYEIELWDSEAREALIWVNLDTIYADRTDQSIIMYWDNDFAVSQSAGSKVFDTAGNFQGIWHLSDLYGDSISDATPNNFKGIAFGMNNASVTKGIIGKCRLFDGSSSYITFPNTADSKLNFQENSQYTISAWTYVNSIDSTSHVVISKGNNQYFIWYTSIHQSSTLWEFTEYHANTGWDLSTYNVTSGEWLLLTGVRDGLSQRLYVNGICVDSTGFKNAGVWPRDETFDVTIGRFMQLVTNPLESSSYCYFSGKIDEVRISSLAHSSDWIKLCYMNQRTDNKLVIFK